MSTKATKFSNPHEKKIIFPFGTSY